MTIEKMGQHDLDRLNQVFGTWKPGPLSNQDKPIEGLTPDFQPVIEPQSRAREAWEWVVVRLLRIT